MCPGFGLGTQEAVTTVDPRNSLPIWLLEHSRDKGAPGTEVKLLEPAAPTGPSPLRQGAFCADTPKEEGWWVKKV